MAAITFDSVSKYYRLGNQHGSLRDAIAAGVRKIARREPDTQQLRALNDVSFSVKRGEVLGVIGHNGAGKSTLLKLAAGVTQPSNGSIHVEGRVASLIELGAGFHPELTGAENIYLNGTMFGLNNGEIDRRFDDIVAFAGLRRFVDTPVKQYSSGMYVRLAFAIAAHVKADVLVIDELLSVGDAAFQAKCLDHMTELRRKGATMVFVSHNLWAVESFCTQALLLRSGSVENYGGTAEVANTYRQYERQDLLANAVSALAGVDIGERDAQIEVALLGPEGAPARHIEPGSTVTVEASYGAAHEIRDARFVFRIRRTDGTVCCVVSNYGHDDAASLPTRLLGQGVVRVEIGPLPLMPDVYTVEAHIVDRFKPITYASAMSKTFRVGGIIGDEAGIFQPAYRWLGQAERHPVV